LINFTENLGEQRRDSAMLLILHRLVSDGVIFAFETIRELTPVEERGRKQRTVR
jgi:hypothetical protein